ncbi:MAG TPA: hypothetical protein ENL33_00795 [Candidatus Parcubacteria bacterium]|nr:hypothetical protein [Candidatus Parcubacteria bacterium]
MGFEDLELVEDVNQLKDELAPFGAALLLKKGGETRLYGKAIGGNYIFEVKKLERGASFLYPHCRKEVVYAKDYFCEFCKKRVVLPGVCPDCLILLSRKEA